MAFLKPTLNKEDNIFFEVEWKQSSHSQSSPGQEPNMLIYSDNLGMGEKLSKYIQHGLSYIAFNNWDSDIQMHSLLNSECNDVVFMWGIHRLANDMSDNLTQYLAKCCEVYRQLIVAVNQKTHKTSIRTVTFRTVERTVDHINPGFSLVGMTRTCVMEIPEITFQLIDISSSSTQDVAALAQVLLHYDPNDYPEIWINDGSIYTSQIIYTDTEKRTRQIESLQKSDNFSLYTSDPYKISDISAEHTNLLFSELKSKEIEINVDKICTHTDDYFPVSLSSWKYGNALYWTANEKHDLIALDFAGIVTAVGKDVKKIQVGDQVAVCYPIIANSKLTLPESVCYLVKKAPILRNVPCVSFFILSWEILDHQLPRPKNKPKLIIVISHADSILCNVLCKTAEQAGWDAVTSNGNTITDKECAAMIVLPTAESISREALTDLPLLKNVIVLSDQNIFKYVILNARQDIHVHLLDPAVVFQKAYLQQYAKDLHTWIYSTSTEINIVSELIIEPSNKKSKYNNTLCTYSTAQAIPHVELDDNNISKIFRSTQDPRLFKHSGVYIVTGGLTGLGFETVKFIIRNGGGNVVILSRRNPTPEMEQQIAEAQNEKENTKIVSLQCNIINYSEVLKAIDSIRKILPKLEIKGVFHSAVVLHDAIMHKLNFSLFEKVLSPKVDGAVNLHRATLNIKLDYFVCYSSVASFAGNSGQANYAAANSFLDIFCQYRRNMGLCGQSISWGGLNLGLLLNKQKIQELLEAKGIMLLSTKETHEYLKKSLLINNTHQAITKFNFKTMYDNLMSYTPALKKRFSNVMEEEMKSWEQTPNENQPSSCNNETCDDYVLLVVSELTGVSSSDITTSSLLGSLGIDSMLAMTLQNRIFKDKNANIPLVKFLDPNSTISMLVTVLKEATCDKKKD